MAPSTPSPVQLSLMSPHSPSSSARANKQTAIRKRCGTGGADELCYETNRLKRSTSNWISNKIPRIMSPPFRPIAAFSPDRGQSHSHCRRPAPENQLNLTTATERTARSIHFDTHNFNANRIRLIIEYRKPNFSTHQIGHFARIEIGILRQVSSGSIKRIQTNYLRTIKSAIEFICNQIVAAVGAPIRR